MNPNQLEERLKELESEIEQVRAEFRDSNSQGWRSVVGSHKGSSEFGKIVREVRRLREEDYENSAE